MDYLKFLQNKKILITGGAGFIGSNLSCFLAQQNIAEITILDDFSTGKENNIIELKGNPKVKILRGDIRDLNDCRNACKEVNIVFHQAALGSVQRSIHDPLSTNAVNVTGFLNILQAARDAGVQRIVYASSSSVYGDDKTIPKVETKTGNVLSPYAVSKQTNEEYARVFAEHYQMEIIGLRYFNVYGPKQDVLGAYAAVIPIFLDAMINKKETVIYGDGSNSRDFTYIDNVIEANMRAASVTLRDEKAPVFNIACGATTSLNELHNILSQETDNKLKPIYLEARKGDIRDSFADISKAISILGYSPKVNLSDGIQKTVEWWRKKNTIVNPV